MNRSIRPSVVMLLAGILGATLPLDSTGLAAEKGTKAKTASQPDKKYESLKAEFAEKCPRFAVAWREAVTSGSPDDSLALAKRLDNKQVIELGGSHGFASCRNTPPRASTCSAQRASLLDEG